MINPLSKTPFLLLLLPLLAGIICQYYYDIHIWSIAFFLVGTASMLFSYFVHPDKSYQLRWLFGAGMLVFLFGLGITLTKYAEQKSEYIFSDEWATYQARVISNGLAKPKSDAYELELVDSKKKLIAYFDRDSTQVALLPGDIIQLKGKIQPFRNRGYNPRFHYVQYMHNKGFSGSVYVASTHWRKEGEQFTPSIYALLLRHKMLHLYQSLDIDDTELGILSALTLGSKETLSDDVIQSFRTTGTVHVLSISGLHVGIIYMFILFLLRPIHSRSRFSSLKPIIVILLLWFYAFVTGLSPSVVRAATMLSVYCVGELFGRKKHALHALYITAFFMLIVDPLLLFDVGFQLSFSAVLGILYFYPYVEKLVSTKSKLSRWLWSSFSLSVVAQLSTLPICLYYFGTFPTYFFIANILVVPAITILLYCGIGVLAVAGINSLLGDSLAVMLNGILYIPKAIIWLLTHCLQWFESLPYAMLDELYLSIFELFSLLTIIATVMIYLVNKQIKILNISLFASVLLIVFGFCS